MVLLCGRFKSVDSLGAHIVEHFRPSLLMLASGAPLLSPEATNDDALEAVTPPHGLDVPPKYGIIIKTESSN
jgi:hypothetical protein